jgi:ribosomal protein L11 methylase PrmA
MIEFEPASFKDPAGRVFYHDNWVGRTLSAEARQIFEAASNAGLIRSLVDANELASTELVPSQDLGLAETEVGSHVLKQTKFPLVSYSYEWSFEMLRDAALLTLRVIERALHHGFVLKDANAFNVLFDGRTPKLVDVHSLEPYREGEIWAGYTQFCRSFLFPLLVAAYCDIDAQPILRATLGEVPVGDARRILGARFALKSGVFRDVIMQARLERAFSRRTNVVKAETVSQSYPKALFLANLRRLQKIIEGLPAPPAHSEWADYEDTHSYSAADQDTKTAFVATALERAGFRTVVDVGCNAGEYSIVAAAAGALVFALDGDGRAIDRLYRRLGVSGVVCPIVADLLNPTPAMGWALKERRSLLERLRADGFLALALIHHLRISGNVPLRSILDQLLAIAPEGIVEWVDKRDAMVQEMLRLRPDVYDDYTWPTFEALMRERAEVVDVRETHGGQRRLCHVRSHRRS